MPHFARPTVRTYLLFGFCLLTTLPIFTLGVLQSFQTERYQVAQSDQQVANAAHTLASAFDQYLDLRIAEVNGFARQVEGQPQQDGSTLQGLVLRQRVLAAHPSYLAVGSRSGTWLAAEPEAASTRTALVGKGVGIL